MARIKQLSAQEAQKIAAGEVVERPANVVKELVENALDAGATQIIIYIEDAGKKLIRIVDNGYGMSQEDAHLCFKHHATSKINSVDDLHALNTFGFRGEALSSISSVSTVTLITKEAAALSATKLTLHDGTVISEEQIPGNTGTDIAIANLFYNVPARKKFLKTNETEWRQIQLLFQAICLDYQDVHFKLYHQNNLVFNCPATNDMQQRIAQLWDHTIAQQTIPIQYVANNFKIAGVITNHTYSRYDRSALYFLVNKRWVKNHTLSKALLKGYLNVLPHDKFPLACIAITIDPAEIDVNIHPRKEEVQFLHPRILENALHVCVKEALEKNLSAQLNKQVSFNSDQTWFDTPRFARHSPRTDLDPLVSLGSLPLAQDNRLKWSKTGSELGQAISNPEPLKGVTGDELDISHTLPARHSFEEATAGSILEKNVSKGQHEIAASAQTQNEYNIIGQFHKTYILIEQDEALLLVDQHAAHERILYEEFAHRLKEVATIQLLFPQVITLTAQELQILEPHLAIFAKNNIALEIMGTNQLIVQAIPVHLKEVAMEDLIRQTIGWITENQKLDADEFYKKVNEKLHAQMACKAAVKAGDILTMAQMYQLLRDLETIENRFTCPHGRPTSWQLPIYEIEKKFKRKI